MRQLVDDVRDLLPPGGAIGRTDTDELAVLLPGMAARPAAAAVEQALGSLRGTRALPGGGEVRADPVAGIAGWPEHALDAEGLFMAADAALADAIGGASGAVVVAALGSLAVAKPAKRRVPAGTTGRVTPKGGGTLPAAGTPRRRRPATRRRSPRR